MLWDKIFKEDSPVGNENQRYCDTIAIFVILVSKSRRFSALTGVYSVKILKVYLLNTVVSTVVPSI